MYKMDLGFEKLQNLMSECLVPFVNNGCERFFDIDVVEELFCVFAFE